MPGAAGTLDTLAGIGVSGHAHPRLVAAAQRAGRPCRPPQHLRNPQQTEAQPRTWRSNPALYKEVISNNGSEANEAAIKLARFYYACQRDTHAHIITMDSSWHGRTLATLAATGSDKAHARASSTYLGFIQVPYNDAAAIPRRGRRRAARGCRAARPAGRRRHPPLRAAFLRRCASAAGC